MSSPRSSPLQPARRPEGHRSIFSTLTITDIRDMIADLEIERAHLDTQLNRARRLLAQRIYRPGPDDHPRPSSRRRRA